MAEVGLLPFAHIALQVGRAVLPRYRSRFSKRQFTQQQLLAILCLMRYEDWTFREALGTRPRSLVAHAGASSPAARIEFQSVSLETSPPFPEDVNRAWSSHKRFSGGRSFGSGINITCPVGFSPGGVFCSAARAFMSCLPSSCNLECISPPPSCHAEHSQASQRKRKARSLS